MNKKMWWIAWTVIIITVFNYCIVLADSRLEIIAPGGGFMDLVRQTMKYQGSNSEFVEVRWNESVSEKILQRFLKSYELSVELNRDYFIAQKDVLLKYDEATLLSGDSLEWDRNNNFFRLSGKSMVTYKDWIVKGNKIESYFNKELLTIDGSAEASNKANMIRGGKIIFDRSVNKIFIQEEPVIIRGNNEMSASEIIYDLKTNQVSANGTVKTRIINEAK